ncbi:MAG: hypothetical protein IPN42_15900 [Methylococcaceae bacterium]|nr:hypothetical protein [Methylococcaceae bacterium]
MNQWQHIKDSMQNEGIALKTFSRKEVTDLCNNAIRVDTDEMYFHEPDVFNWTLQIF